MRAIVAFLAALLLAAPARAAGSPTLAAVQARGALVCGVSGLSPGFSMPDSQGVMRGLDADSCRAIAAAVFGDADKVRFRPLTAQVRFTALQTGEVDVVYANGTWTLGREAGLGLLFASVTFHDGQTFMVRTSSGVASAKQLDGATVCMLSGGSSEGNVADFFAANGMRFTPVLFEGSPEVRAAFLAGRCDALTNDASALAGFRSTLADRDAFRLLPEIISHEPLGGAVRGGDDVWFDIVRWAHFATVMAEELGVTQANLAAQRGSKVPAVRRLLGLDGNAAQQLGLSPGWADAVIAAVGNYGEMWARNITPIGIPRGVNRLWSEGGMQFSPPFR